MQPQELIWYLLIDCPLNLKNKQIKSISENQKDLTSGSSIINIDNLDVVEIFGVNNENLNFGAYHDWINANLNPLIDFSNSFVDTFLNYEKYGHRHSPVYLIFLSFLKSIGFDFDSIRFIHLNLSILLIYFFYKEF